MTIGRSTSWSVSDCFWSVFCTTASAQIFGRLITAPAHPHSIWVVGYLALFHLVNYVRIIVLLFSFQGDVSFSKSLFFSLRFWMKIQTKNLFSLSGACTLSASYLMLNSFSINYSHQSVIYTRGDILANDFRYDKWNSWQHIYTRTRLDIYF